METKIRFFEVVTELVKITCASFPIHLPCVFSFLLWIVTQLEEKEKSNRRWVRCFSYSFPIYFGCFEVLSLFVEDDFTGFSLNFMSFFFFFNFVMYFIISMAFNLHDIPFVPFCFSGSAFHRRPLLYEHFENISFFYL